MLPVLLCNLPCSKVFCADSALNTALHATPGNNFQSNIYKHCSISCEKMFVVFPKCLMDLKYRYSRRSQLDSCAEWIWTCRLYKEAFIRVRYLNSVVVFLNMSYPLFQRCHFNSEGKLGGVFGPDSVSSPKDWYSSWCHGCQKAWQTLFYHLLWGKWCWKINQFSQG